MRAYHQMTIRTAIILLLALLCGWPAKADSNCTPRTFLSSEEWLTLDRRSLEFEPQMMAKTIKPLKILMTDALSREVGLDKEGNEARLAGAVLVRGFILESGQLERNVAKLEFIGKTGPIWIRHKDRTFELDLVTGAGAKSRVVDVSPKFLEPATIVLEPGTRISRQGDALVVASGSRIAWDLYAPENVPFQLLTSVPLREVNFMKSAGRVIGVSPSRSLPGGKVLVTLAVSDFDFKAFPPPVFCVSKIGSQGTIAGVANGVPGDLVSRSADQAVFSVHIPETWISQSDIASDQVDLGGIWRAVTGTPATLRVLVNNKDGLAIDSTQSLTITNRLAAALLALAVTALTTWALARALITLRPSELVRDLVTNNGRYSLSNVQVFLWTVLVLFSLFYVWLAIGKIILISSGIMLLLGISGGTLVLSRTIETLGSASGSPAQRPAASDLISKDGSFDVSRYQMLAFTIFAWIYALVSVLRSEGLPEIPESLYLLMGISSATYVGSKLPAVVANTGGSTAASTAAPYPGEESPDIGTIKRLQAVLKVPETGLLDDTTRAAIVTYKDINGIIPVTPRLDAMLLKKILR